MDQMLMTMKDFIGPQYSWPFRKKLCGFQEWLKTFLEIIYNVSIISGTSHVVMLLHQLNLKPFHD
jgi:hypothetical protein